MSTQATHADRVAEHARARALAPAHASPWRHAVNGAAVGGLARADVRTNESKPKRRTKAQREEAQLALVGRTLETSSGALTLSEEQVDAMSDDEAAAVLASAKAQDAAAAAQPE